MTESSSSTLESELEMWQLPYYHGLLLNADFRQLLTNDGDFLVRRGHGTSGQERIIVLSMNVCSRLRHVIFRQRRGLVAVDFRRERGFETIQSFVDAHLGQTDSISSQELVVLMRAIDRKKWKLSPSVLDISKQQPLRMDELDIFDDDWIDVLAWIGRVEVGTKFAVINAQFSNWVSSQLTERKWALGKLSICRAKDGTGAKVLCSNNVPSLQMLPVPNTPLPGSIFGFQSIIIRYIDQSVVTFLRNIRRLFTLDTCLEFSILYTEDQSWRIMAQEIWPLVKDGVCTLLTERKWALGKLSICRAKDGTGAKVLCSNNVPSLQMLPVPNTPLPGSIFGFQSIIIRYIDQSVVTFLRNIRRLFTLDTCLEFSILYTEDQSWRIMAQEIWPLVKDGVCTLVNMQKNHFSMMRKYISPTVLFDCVNLRRIYSHMYPQCPTDNDSADALPAARDLYAWLHVTRADHFPAVLSLYKWKPKWQPMLDSLTKTFREAYVGVNFVIFCTFPFFYDAHFRLVNELTHEQMALATRNVNGTNAVVMRCPNGCEVVSEWASYANEPLTNYVHIDFGDADIGPLPSSNPPMKVADGNRPEAEFKI
uniref:SH2 domain-containing protein n=1 Tax=Globodera pallida TaxID=36090 RepID=A0A183CLQ9_GLOPA